MEGGGGREPTYSEQKMSGSEELAQAEEEQVEGGEEFEGTEDDQELAAMQKELEKAEQQKAELDKLNKMQGGASADSKQSELTIILHDIMHLALFRLR